MPFNQIRQSVVIPAEYNVTMVNADQQYSQVLPAGTRRFAIKTQDGSAFRFSYTTGKVAAPTVPFTQVASNTEYEEKEIYFINVTTIYFASDKAGKIAQITAWIC